MITKEIIIHHSASPLHTTVKEIDNWHKARWPQFKGSLGYWAGYHFIITSDGKITQTRRENEIGAHTIPNEGRLGICLTGNFQIDKPTPAQLKSLTELLEKIKKEYKLTDNDIYGHYEKSLTICPGNEMKIWLNKYRQVSILKRVVELLKRLLRSVEN
jgi:N-acetylmuramoyl-L-alanine amidase